MIMYLLLISNTSGIGWTFIPKSSLNGVNWTVTFGIKYWANRWIAVGTGTYNGNQMPIITSIDGLIWNNVVFPTTIQGEYAVYAVDYSATVWLVCGFVLNSVDSKSYPFIYKSTDAINWSPVDLVPGFILTGILSDLRWVDNKWLICGNIQYTDNSGHINYIQLLKSNNYDASNMQLLNFNYGTPYRITSFNNKDYVATALYPKLYRYNTAGIWINLSNPLDSVILGFSTYYKDNNDKEIFICGNETNGLAIARSTDGYNFTQCTGSYNLRINCLSKFMNNNTSILAGGSDGTLLYSINGAQSWGMYSNPDFKKYFNQILSIEVAFI